MPNTVNLRVEEGSRLKLKMIAASTGLTMQEVFRQLVNAELERMTDDAETVRDMLNRLEAK